MKWLDEIKTYLNQTSNGDYTEQNHQVAITHPLVESLVQNYKDAACYFDYKGDVLTYNKKLIELIGLKDNDKTVLQQTFKQMFKHFHPDVSMDGSSQMADDILTQQDGDRLPIKVLHTPLFIEGQMVGTFCTICPQRKTVNETQKTKNELKEQYRNNLNRLDLAIFSVDTIKKNMEFISDAIEDIYEMPKAEVTINTWERLTHPDDYEEVQLRFSSLLSGENFTQNFRIVTPNGNNKWIKVKAIPIKNDNGQITHVIGTIEDCTKVMELQKKLEHMAYIDELTQLPNRYYGRQHIKNMIEDYSSSNTTFALLLINLDDFSRVNEVFGHDIGDEAIKQTANRLNTAIINDGFLCRVSGDEMLIIMSGQPNIKGYYHFAKELLQLIEEPLHINDYKIYLTATIGISIYPTDGNDNESLVNRANKALIYAKKLGIGDVQLFSSTMNIESFKSFQLENDLRQALVNDELYLDYQPIIDAGTQQASGAEALIRWKHPVWGKVSPAEFIPVAENGPIIHDIGKFVIENVCRQAGEWIKEGVRFNHLSFNLSPKNFLKSNLLTTIKKSIEHYHIPSHLLKIEITEGVLLKETDVVRDQINKLKEMGVNIALDDYGVGYSSINYLKQYPIDTLKIDRSFIQHVDEEGVDAVVVQSIIDLAKGLNRKVVGEGVENRVQLDKLKKMGCDLIQGYLFSKPVSPKKMKEIFQLESVYPQESNNQISVERRQYFRVTLPQPLKAELTILSINQKSVTLGETEILVQDIGLGGLRFISHLRLMPEAEILYGFNTTLLETPLNIKGKIVWGNEKVKDIFEYGIEFSIDENERDHLSSVLNKLSTKIKSNPEFIDDQFINQQPIPYIKHHYLNG